MKKNLLKLLLLTILIIQICLLFETKQAAAATNISSEEGEHWAWNDIIGWIDFYSTGNVEVTDYKIKGYASSSVGYIALDCETSPNGNICSSSNFKVENNCNGELSGFAWNEVIGWISFNCRDLNVCTQSNYRVTIDAAGNFQGWAWNDIIGWISFNSNNPGAEGPIDYKVKTSWSTSGKTGYLVSLVYDTGIESGAGFNSLMWKGYKPSGTKVKFQFASSNCPNGATNPPQCDTGEWKFLGPGGTGLETDVYEPIGPNFPIKINRSYHNNHRYFRYKVILESDPCKETTPLVEEIIINWSP